MNIEQLQNLPDAEKAKLFAARHAIAFVKPNMKIGIGSGSTVSWFVKLLAQAQANGLNFRACATSSQITKLAESLGIKIESLDALGLLDLAVDGADEFSPVHQLIKGGGGALLQEKITAYDTGHFMVITDASKAVDMLGKFPLPVEIVRFAWQTTRARIANVLSSGDVGGNEIKLRMAGDKPFVTDGGNYILDLHLKSIGKHFELDRGLHYIPGVVETGLFLNMADEIVMADSTGLVKSQIIIDEWKETRYELAEIADMLLQD